MLITIIMILGLCGFMSELRLTVKNVLMEWTEGALYVPVPVPVPVPVLSSPPYSVPFTSTWGTP